MVVMFFVVVVFIFVVDIVYYFFGFLPLFSISAFNKYIKYTKCCANIAFVFKLGLPFVLMHTTRFVCLFVFVYLYIYLFIYLFFPPPG